MKHGDIGESDANASAKPIRTIVVDDSALWLKELCAFLESEPGIAIVGTAHDGLESLGRVEVQRPQLVILDIQMPRMNGFEAAKLIRARFPEVRVLMMSVNCDSWTREACFAQGAHAFVDKAEAAAKLLPAIFRLFSGGTAPPPTAPGLGQF